MNITLQDIRACKFCRKGAKQFFEKHGLDWDGMRRDGIPEEQLTATGDALALRLVEESKHGRQS